MGELTAPSHCDAAVTAIDLRIRRGSRWGSAGHEVIHGISFSVPRGTVTGIIGPSGGGKTTLMRSIVGVQSGISGTLRVLGREPGHADLRSRVGYATQTASVYNDLTVEENLRYFAALADGTLSKAAVVDRAERVMADVGLTGKARTPVGRLSGGQRSRVSLAAAILGGTDLLVLDEPTVGLDPVLRQELWDDFHQMAQSGITLLVSSHVMEEAGRCDRLLLLRDGHLIADDTPRGLLASTGADDLDQAFLRLVEKGEDGRDGRGGPAAGSGRGGAARPAPSAPPAPPAPPHPQLPATSHAYPDPPGQRMPDPPEPAFPPGDGPKAGGPGPAGRPVRLGGAGSASACATAPVSRTAVAPRPSPPARASGHPLVVPLGRTADTVRRVTQQMRRDRRSAVMVLTLPPALFWLLQQIFRDNPAAFDRVGVGLLGVFPLMTMFFQTSVAMLRERRSGTLERLLTTPVGRGELLTGYAIAFSGLAVAQAGVTTAVAVGLLGLNVAGPLPMLLLIAVLASVFGTALGLLTSAFAYTEFQAVQFLPPVLLPQFLLCGILVPRDEMHPVLDTISALLPMTYVVDALNQLSSSPEMNSRILVDALVIAGCVVVALALAAGTLRRRGG